MASTEIIYCESIDKGSTAANAIHELLVLCDSEFKPHLSARTDADRALSVQQEQNNKNEALFRSIEPYFEIVLQQKNIIAVVDGAVAAFMSFKYSFEKSFYFPSVFRSGDVINYITTICTHPDFRGRKLASQLYEFIEKSLPNTVKAECVSTRTWNTNIEHIRLLEKRGYKLTCTLHEDRRNEDGTMLDTVYYCKRTENKI